MSILTDTLTLANGVVILRLGFGTWLIPDVDAAEAVRAAIEVGYRNVDAAQAYGNEDGVDEGVRASACRATNCSSPPSSPPRSRTTTWPPPRSTRPSTGSGSNTST